MLAGQQFYAGLGVSTVLPSLDWETYSEAGYLWDVPARKWLCLPNAPQGRKGLKVVGLDVYANHPSTDILCLAYDLKDGRGRRRWRPGQPLPLDLWMHAMNGGLLSAWNSGFELRIWNCVATRRYGFPPLNPLQMRCDMAKARAFALPGGLEETGDVLELNIRKDKDGARLLDKFSVPRQPTKKDPRTRIRPEDDPADFERLVAYNDTDVASEDEAALRIPDLSPVELQHWQNDQAINQRGVAIDLAGVDACIAIVTAAIAKYTQELQDLTGGIKPTELEQLKGWLHARGVHVESLDEENVDELLKKLPRGSAERRAIEIRAAVGSASVKKVFAMRHRVGPDGRLRDMYIFHGARTGRPTGEGAQPTNMPKAGPDVYRCGWQGKVQLPGGGCGRWHGAHTMRCPWCGASTLRGPKAAAEWSPPAMKDALAVIMSRSLELVEYYFGDAMHTVAGVLRGLYVAAEGCELVSSDFTAIEGVVIACLAGEKWRIDAYANDEPMYLLSAERSYGVPVAEMQAYAKQHGHHHPLRQKGKIGELALGFGGWIGALRSMGADGPDEDLKDQVLKWRAASPAVVEFWGGQSRGKPWDGSHRRELFGLEGMIVAAIQNPGTEYPVRRLDGTFTGVSYLMRGDVLYCRVPDGGYITYHRPRLSPSRRPYAAPWELSITYEGWNSNPKMGPPGWQTLSLYAGKAAENVVQKVARDIQMGAINRCERASLPVVLHTYDEIVGEVLRGSCTVQRLEGLMCDVQPWARGWPIKAAGGWVDDRYQKA